MITTTLTRHQEQVLALAGVFQAATLVASLAEKGQCDTLGFETSINSLFTLNAKDTLSVYGQQGDLSVGLRQMTQFAEKQDNMQRRMIDRYVIGLLWLEKKLSKKTKYLEKIKQIILRAEQQSHHFSTTHPNVIANLADAYLDTLGTFRFRLQILGNPNYLQNKDLVNRIRATLLAGVRSAVLFRQKGGSIMQLLFRKDKLKKEARMLLRHSFQQNRDVA